MSRSGYSEGCDGWALIRWRGAVKSALRGERGQRFLRELAAAMDAMPDKRLGLGAFQDEQGCLCTLGVVAAARGIDLNELNRLIDEDEEVVDRDSIARRLGVATAMAAEIMFMNDEGYWWRASMEQPEARWARMRAWVQKQIEEPGCE